ncbi:hypothetical protein D623_10006735 [Myotis brandtii]|uniref:Uncharacterized protein n=1 Tax=Myotis brandtii TaxID=109478 RepID=S7NVG5_MYOBR|nr:hypothetical protein D623_10006735 [Myotis brandtii]
MVEDPAMHTVPVGAGQRCPAAAEQEQVVLSRCPGGQQPASVPQPRSARRANSPSRCAEKSLERGSGWRPISPDRRHGAAQNSELCSSRKRNVSSEEASGLC